MRSPYFFCREEGPIFCTFFLIVSSFLAPFLSLSLSLFARLRRRRENKKKTHTRRRRRRRDGRFDERFGAAATRRRGKIVFQKYYHDIIIIAFDGEESGLHGSRFYVNNPAQPLEDLNLMINFDMIGRIENDRRLSISGTGTGEGMSDWARPLFEASSLEIVESEASSGGSDHSEFLSKRVPILFAITPFPLHNDYHTSRDTSNNHPSPISGHPSSSMAIHHPS